jgi:hypothetical protein
LPSSPAIVMRVRGVSSMNLANWTNATADSGHIEA